MKIFRFTNGCGDAPPVKPPRPPRRPPAQPFPPGSNCPVPWAPPPRDPSRRLRPVNPL